MKRTLISSFAAGLLMHLAFAPWNFFFLAPVAAALLFFATRFRTGFLPGFVYGLGLFFPMLHWLKEFHILAPVGAVLLSAVPYGAITRIGPKTPVTFAASMTAAEFFRTLGVFAFPWGVAGTLAADSFLRSLASVIGLFGLSFLLYLFSALIIERRRIALLFCLVPLCALALRPALPSERISVGLVQGNFSIAEDYEFRPGEVMDFLTTETRRLAGKGAKIIVWTETVVLEYLNQPGTVRDSIERLANQEGVTILVGAPSLLSEHDKRNSVFLFGAGNFRYDKVHLVPFGEYVPGYGPEKNHELFPHGTGDFSPALVSAPLDLCGPLICYEGVLPGLARSHVRQGAGVLVNLSNDAWAQSSAEAEQHFQLTRLRAAELARPLIRAGNVGRSAIIDAGGEVVAELPPNASGSIMASIGLNASKTVIYFLGEWVGWACLLGIPFFLTVKELFVEVLG